MITQSKNHHKSFPPASFHLIIFTFSLLTLLILPTASMAACDQGDAPDCICFDDTGDWDAGGTFIQDTALDTVGTRESCNTGIAGDPLEKDSGKPYYSIVLGYNTEASALAAAGMMAAGVGSFENRQAWCSESISYWHKETGIPYSVGYYNPDWHLDWLVKSVGDLRNWYETEEDGGRGRWIEAGELDYDDFQPGINAPVPGAYMAWTGCVQNVITETWQYYAFHISHSLMIDEMWIHRDGHGNIFQVEVSFLEGNSGNRVKNTRKWDDLIAFTPQGSQWIGWNEGSDKIANTIDDIGIKIYGFGVDLTEQGEPIYDTNRLHYVDHPYMRKVVVSSIFPEDDEWETNYGVRLPALKTFAATIRKNQGALVSCPSQQLLLGNLPNGADKSWTFPQGTQGDVVILIDLLSPNPLPLQGVRIFWDPAYIPADFTVEVMDSEQNYIPTKLPDLANINPAQNSGPIPVQASFDRPVNNIRYIRLTFPDGTFIQNTATITNLLLPYYQGKYADSNEVTEDLPVWIDIKPGECPNILKSSDPDKISIAMLGSKTVETANIDIDSLLFNGQSLKTLSHAYKDVSTPFIGTAPGCHTLGADGYTDLILTFDIVEFIDILNPGSIRPLPVRVTGKLASKLTTDNLLGQDFVEAEKSESILLMIPPFLKKNRIK